MNSNTTGWEACPTLSKPSFDVIRLQRIPRRALQVRDRFVQLGLRTELCTAGRSQRRLPFEHSINIGLAVVEFPLFGFVLLDRILTSDRRRTKACFRGSKCLQSISHIYLNVLFDLCPLHIET